MVTQHFNKLTPAQAERLALLAEECGEVIQVIGKILRHGLDSHHPDDPYATNGVLLATELAHVQVAADMLFEHDLSEGEYHNAKDEKRRRVGKYLHHNPESPGPAISYG